jgi:hypothetical protein
MINQERLKELAQQVPPPSELTQADYGLLLDAAELLSKAKQSISIVSRRVWAPGDTYLVAGGSQVMEYDPTYNPTGYKEGQKVVRYETIWEKVDDE